MLYTNISVRGFLKSALILLLVLNSKTVILCAFFWLALLIFVWMLQGRALLHWACDRGHKELVSVLLQHAADVNSQVRKE